MSSPLGDFPPLAAGPGRRGRARAPAPAPAPALISVADWAGISAHNRLSGFALVRRADGSEVRFHDFGSIAPGDYEIKAFQIERRERLAERGGAKRRDLPPERVPVMDSTFAALAGGVPLSTMRDAFHYTAAGRANWPALTAALYGVPTAEAAAWALAALADLVPAAGRLPVALTALAQTVGARGAGPQRTATAAARALGAPDCVAHLGAVECDLPLQCFVLPFFLGFLARAAQLVAQDAEVAAPWFRARLEPAAPRSKAQQFVATPLRALAPGDFSPPAYSPRALPDQAAVLDRLLCPHCAPGRVPGPAGCYYGSLAWLAPPPAPARSPAEHAHAIALDAFAAELRRACDCDAQALPARLLPALLERGASSPLDWALTELARAVRCLPPLRDWAAHWAAALRADPECAAAAEALLALTPELVQRQGRAAARAAAAGLALALRSAPAAERQ